MPNPDNEPKLPKNQSSITDDRTGLVSRDWYRFFLNLLAKVEQGSGGTVTSVAVSGGTTGLTTSGGPITSAGTITMAGVLNVANGGTGAIAAAGARVNLDVPSTTGSGASGTWSIDVTGNSGTVTNGVYTTGSYANPTWITSIAGSKVSGDISGNAANVTGTVAVLNGGTGATTASDARTNLGLIIGTDVPSPTGTGASGTWTINVTGNAGTVTDGVYTTGSYADPIWITSLAGSKVTGAISGQAGSVANALTVGSGLSYSAGTTYNGSAAVTISNAAPMVYPGAGIPNSTGTAWGASYATTGSGTTLVLDTSPSLVTPILGTPQSGNFSTGTFTWPTFNQNTTGTASNVTGVIAIANGGTGQTTAVAAFDALSPATTKGDLIVSNGTDNVRQPVGADTYVLTADSTQATGVKWALSTGSGATIVNDTTTATSLYPTFAAATSGALANIYTSNAKYLYKPSTGELTSPHLVASNGIFVNSLTISTSYTIPSGSSGVSAGVITVASGVTVTVSSGSRWVVV